MMKKAFCLTLALPLSAWAAPVTLTPTDVNRIFGGSYAAIHYSDLFSTYGQPGLNQKTLVLTTRDTFLAALETQLGPASSYTINSAVLTVGASADPYASTGSRRAYPLLHTYDHLAVTWSTFNNGGVQGVDYSSSPAATGAVAGNSTSWTFSPGLIQSWIDGTAAANGLYFPDAGAETNAEYTDKGNVVWLLDATAVPEPGSIVLAAIAAPAATLLLRRSRHGQLG